MIDRPVRLGEIFDELFRLASQHKVLLGIAVLAIAGFYSLLDWMTVAYADKNGITMLSTLAGLIVSLFGQYRLTEHLLADRRQAGTQPSVRRYGSLFGALFLSGLAIVAGLIAFVVPGIYLAGRWLTVTPRIVEDNLSGGEALRASWNDSDQSQVVFALAYLISVTPIIPLIAIALAGWDRIYLSDPAVSILVVNLAMGLTVVSGWTMAAAAYRCVTGAGDGVSEVFS